MLVMLVRLRFLNWRRRFWVLRGDKPEITFKPLPLDNTRRCYPDTGKFERLIGWKPGVEFSWAQ
jgi:hypothetical protein